MAGDISLDPALRWDLGVKSVASDLSFPADPLDIDFQLFLNSSFMGQLSWASDSS